MRRIIFFITMILAVVCFSYAEDASEQFRADFRSALNEYIKDLLLHYNDLHLDTESHSASLERIASLNREFIQTLFRGDDTLLLNVAAIGGIHFNALAVAVLQEKMAEISNAEWIPMREYLLNIITRQHDRRLSNTREFARWYHSMGNNPFLRTWRHARGTYAEFVEEKFNELINAGVIIDEHLEALLSFRTRADVIFTGFFFALMSLGMAEDNERALVVDSMNWIDVFEPYTLTARIAVAGHEFGFDTSDWHNHSMLTRISEIGGMALNALNALSLAAPPLKAMGCILSFMSIGASFTPKLIAGTLKLSILTMNPLPAVVGGVLAVGSGIWGVATTRNNRNQLQEEITNAFINEYERMQKVILAL